MTEKRFVSYFDKEHNYIIQDLIDEDEYQVGFVNCDEDEFLEKINQLEKESVIKTHNIEYWENQCKKLKKNVACLIENKEMLESEFIQPIKEELKDLKETLDVVYQFRLMYNALLFNEWHKHSEVEVYKSKRHSDGSIPFECDSEDWFVVVAILPTGKQITNHYRMDHWNYFKIPEYDKVKDEFDGHTSDDVLDRLMELLI